MYKTVLSNIMLTNNADGTCPCDEDDCKKNSDICIETDFDDTDWYKSYSDKIEKNPNYQPTPDSNEQLLQTFVVQCADEVQNALDEDVDLIDGITGLMDESSSNLEDMLGTSVPNLIGKENLRTLMVVCVLIIILCICCSSLSLMIKFL